MPRRPWYSFALVFALAVSTLCLLVAPSRVSAESAGVIYVTDPACCDAGQSGGVIRVDPSKPAGSNQTVISSGQNFKNPMGVVLAANGKLYVVDRDCCGGGEGAVIEVDPSQPANNNQTVITSGQLLEEAYGIALAADGKLYIADSECCGGGVGGVIRVDPALPAASNQTVVSSGQNFVRPMGLALTTDGKIYVADYVCCGGKGGVILVDPGQPATSNQVVIANAQNLQAPYALIVGADGKLYVVDRLCCGLTGGVVRVDPSQPAAVNQTLISSGQNFQAPFGIALAADGTLYVADMKCCTGEQGGVIRVNPTLPATSNQVIVSTAQNFVDPARLAVVPGVSIADATVTEGTGTSVAANFTVTLAPWSLLPITLPYTLTSGTATADADFNASGSAVTFNPGQTSKTVSVQVVGDAAPEPVETFVVTLQPPGGVGAADGTGTGTIVDNDGMPALSIADVIVTEGNSGSKTATFTVFLAPASSNLVTVQFATSDVSAQVGSDYLATSGTLTFLPGVVSQSIPVTVKGDVGFEPDETFLVTLSSPTGGSKLGKAQATGTIKNDDPPTACNPRPAVVVTNSAGGGKLQVNIASSPLNTSLPNPLQQLQFGSLQNANVMLGAQPITSGQTVTLPANVTTVDFTVERTTAGQTFGARSVARGGAARTAGASVTRTSSGASSTRTR